MAHDSLFIFDINHPDIYPEVWGMAEPFVADGADYHLEIATTYRKREATRPRAGDRLGDAAGRQARDDRRAAPQRAWREREIIDALHEAGLAPIDVIEFDPYGEAESLEVDAVKLFYVCNALPLPACHIEIAMNYLEKSFDIGAIRIDPPLALAPMAEVTDTYYRSLIKELGGVGLVVSEFISAEGLTRKNDRTPADAGVRRERAAGGDPDLRRRSRSDGRRGRDRRGARASTSSTSTWAAR